MTTGISKDSMMKRGRLSPREKSAPAVSRVMTRLVKRTNKRNIASRMGREVPWREKTL